MWSTILFFLEKYPRLVNNMHIAILIYPVIRLNSFSDHSSRFATKTMLESSASSLLSCLILSETYWNGSDSPNNDAQKWWRETFLPSSQTGVTNILPYLRMLTRCFSKLSFICLKKFPSMLFLVC